MNTQLLLTIFGRILVVSVICLAMPVFSQHGYLQIAAHGPGEEQQGDAAAISLIRKFADPISGAEGDYDALMQMIGDARFVLLGEATHGTHEFYHQRARITRRLIEEKGFDAVVIEADWFDAQRVNEYVLGRSGDRTAEKALRDFRRFPRWMWRNTDFRDLVDSIRTFNDGRSAETEKVGIYGMDIYGLTGSIKEVTDYLRRVDAAAWKRAQRRYSCLRGYADRPQQYGYDVSQKSKKSCETQATEQFEEMEKRMTAWRQDPDRQRDDDLFSAYQNARVVKTAEAYYRQSFRREFSTWNLRDSHMAEIIHALSWYMEALGRPQPKIVVWAHNTHQGDAMMTSMGEAGELNVGHLMRRTRPDETILIGFTTHTGRVLAAADWGAPGLRMTVRPSLPGSFSRLFHDARIGNFLLIFRGNDELTEALGSRRPERAIGVVYKPETERQSHYFGARLSRQFDAVIHFDETHPVKPL